MALITQPNFEPLRSRGRRKRHTDFADHKQRMLDIVKVLNGPRPRITRPGKPSVIRRLPPGEMELELRALVSRWMASGPNLRTLLEDDHSLKEKVSHGKTKLFPGIGGQGYFDWIPDFAELRISGREDPTPQARALTYFIDLITNPEWDRLAGPCKKCTDYFLKETKRKRKFCSRKCTSASTAKEHMRLSRIRNRTVKIEKVRRLTDEWVERRPRGFTWQKWVCRGPEISLKWLTHAVNIGDVAAPV